jgi:hypothetical protein
VAETMDVDDPLFVSLRARREELDLKDVVTAMGTEGFAFPMTVAESLNGAVICGPPDGEQFAPDVRAALVEAGRNLGMSVYILRYKEQAHFVADIAAGRIDQPVARRRATSLIEGAY